MYILLKPPKEFHELEKYDENVDTNFVGRGSFITLDEIDEMILKTLLW